jgi:hypothetical protein
VLGPKSVPTPFAPRLRIINTPMGQELIAELNSFEVDFTSAGNMRVDVALEAPPWRFADRDGAYAVVGDRQAFRRNPDLQT